MDDCTPAKWSSSNRHGPMANGPGQDLSVREYGGHEDGESILPELSSPGFENDEAAEWPLDVQIKQEVLDEGETVSGRFALLFQSAGETRNGGSIKEEPQGDQLQQTDEIPTGIQSGDDNSSESGGEQSPTKKRKREQNKRNFHQCGECEMAFSTLKEMSLHLKFHRGETPYPDPYTCPECGFVATSSEGHKDHVRLHTGEKPYRCDTCGKTFRLRSNRNSHLRSHRAARRSLECGDCGRGFSSLAGLVAHESSHLRKTQGRERTFDCFCGRASFSSLGGLKRHEHTAHLNDDVVAPLPVLFSGDLR